MSRAGPVAFTWGVINEILPASVLGATRSARLVSVKTRHLAESRSGSEGFQAELHEAHAPGIVRRK